MDIKRVTEPYTMTKKTRLALLIVAISLLVLVLLWFIFRAPMSSLNKVADAINKFGYDFTADDLLVTYDNAETSISAVLNDVDLSDAVQASKQAGFSSDVSKTGGVTLILASSGDDVITVYLLDGEIELCFIQRPGGEVAAINKR